MRTFDRSWAEKNQKNFVRVIRVLRRYEIRLSVKERISNRHIRISASPDFHDSWPVPILLKQTTDVSFSSESTVCWWVPCIMSAVNLIQYVA